MTLTIQRKLRPSSEDMLLKELRVRGRVQGVGFRPTVWRIARSLGLSGEVLNDAQGVLVRVGGSSQNISAFLKRLKRGLPPLARIDDIECTEFDGELPRDFTIAPSLKGNAQTQIAPDAAICRACAAELTEGNGRRFNYPFTNCTHCGPRLTITTQIPYDRANTTMATFVMCEACEQEYADPCDRRFHAEASACSLCGPQIQLIRLDGRAIVSGTRLPDKAILASRQLLNEGEIVAIKGLGGYQLACDAANRDAVARLRRLKGRDTKPFALMAPDMDVIRNYCLASEDEERILTGPSAPIVLLKRNGEGRIPVEVAPHLPTLGFMLPTTPLHLLLLRGLTHPLVMTSGNLSGEPQAIDDEDALTRLSTIATYALTHNRRIANRVDDSVARFMAGRVRVFRRARGYAPAPIKLPHGFEVAPQLAALGGELKTTFCLLKNGEATLSQHQGDLHDMPTFDDYRRNLAHYTQLFDHQPTALVIDQHPDFISSKYAHKQAGLKSLPVLEVQHHHAHVASCLAENGYALDAAPILGIVLDGVGLGDDGTIWGGEFLLANYYGYERLGAFKPVFMPGGDQAVREPWRNLYAHLMAIMDWEELSTKFAQLGLYRELEKRPRPILDGMIRSRVNAPLASSCGRLFDAVAAALGICVDRQDYEGEAAICLEGLADESALRGGNKNRAYPFAVSQPRFGRPRYLEPELMWRRLLDDLSSNVPPSLVSARFHRGLAAGVVAMAKELARSAHAQSRQFHTIALSGGCFQNHILLSEVAMSLERANFRVLTHADVPSNDGGLSLGQAAIGAARLMRGPISNASG